MVWKKFIYKTYRDTRKSSGFQFWVKLFTILKCFRLSYNILYFIIEKKQNTATDVLDGDGDDDGDDDSHSHSLSLFPSLFRTQSASFSSGLRSYSKYVHQQTEHDAIKLLFIFVFISFQHHTSFSYLQWLRRRGFVFIRSSSLSLIRLLFSFYFLLFFICFKVALLFYLQNNTSKLH